jgi:hypothetical protein
VDNGPLTDDQYRVIEEQVPQHGFSGSRKRLF